MRKIFSVKLLFPLLLSVFLVVNGVAKDTSVERTAAFQSKRNKLIGYMLGKMLPNIHYSDKEVDDQLAEAIFDLYLKQLDYQKRFLLKEDVDLLRSFTMNIDDSIKTGMILLPRSGYDLLNGRLIEIQKITEDIFADGFDINREDVYEADPEKYDYVHDLDGMKARWRQMLKLQVMSRYLDLLEERDKSKKEDEIASRSDEELFAEAVEKIKKRNQTFFKRMHQETLQDQYDRFFLAVTRSFGPHTSYMAPASKEEFDIHMRGSLEGIGALLREDGGYIKVVSIVPGSASAKQGELEAEDIIVAVAQGADEPVEITDMRLNKAVRLIRGPKGTEVRLTVRKPSGAREIISIVRDVVEMEDAFVKSTMLTSRQGLKIGYVFVPSFYRDFEGSRNGEGEVRNSTTDTRTAVEELSSQGMEALVLDLRNNGGGSLIDAVDIAGLFIDSGPVVQVKSSNGGNRVLEDETRGVSFAGPMVVLVNQFSASASEIVAAALQDYKRAVIVGGAHTHGKGTVQTVIDLNQNVPFLSLDKNESLGALKVTIQKYYRVTGGSTQYKGVEPDIVLPSLFQHLKSGEKYLDYSLPWDQGPAVKYKPVVEDIVNLDQIREKSAARVAQDPGFIAIADEAERAMKNQDDTAVSLRLEDMKTRRAKLRTAQKKIGRYYKKYQQIDADEEESSKKRDPEKEKQKWLDEVFNDPYIQEAKNIIDDMNLSSSEGS